MFERPEEWIATHRSWSAARRATATACDALARHIAHDTAASDRELTFGRWHGDGTLDLCASQLSRDAIDALRPAFDSGRVRHAMLCANRLGPEQVTALATCEHLESLWLGDNQIASEGALHALRVAPRARALWIGKSALMDRHIDSICESIRSSDHLEFLDVSVSELSPEGAVAVASAARDRGLRGLCLDGNGLTLDAARALARLLDDWSELALLRLNATRLSGEALAAVCAALARAPSLRALGLSGNGLRDDDASTVASLVRASASLRAIELGYVRVEHCAGAMPNALTARGASVILEACGARRALRSIDLRGASLAPEAAAALVATIEAGGSIDAVAHEGLHRGPHGDTLRATLARNANRARAAHPSDRWLRELLSPLRRWRAAVDGRMTAARSIAQRVAPAPVERASSAELAKAIAVIERTIARDPRALDEDERALRAAAGGFARAQQRSDRASRHSAPDEAQAISAARDSAKIAEARAGHASAPAVLDVEHKCYACRARFAELDPRYVRLCPACAREHHRRRAQGCELEGCLALVTGARVRIGFRTTLSLLRMGAEVVATTRFVNEAWARYAREADFDRWRARLSLRPLDLRFSTDVQRFAQSIATERRALDILVNNAAQTVAREAGFYAALRAEDERAAAMLPAGVTPSPSMLVSDSLESAAMAHREPARGDDLRGHNSWRAHIEHVSVGELLSAHAVNVVAPFVLISTLRSALSEAAALRGSAFVINVTAIEGQFAQRRKPPRHPHTNAAKAALNMLTHTIAEDFARENVYVHAVDPGWVSAQNPFAQDAAMRARGFAPPLDDQDGAARVIDPVVRRKRGEPVEHGVLLKDYAVAPW